MLIGHIFGQLVKDTFTLVSSILLPILQLTSAYLPGIIRRKPGVRTECRYRPPVTRRHQLR
jgi:hypothetical protein